MNTGEGAKFAAKSKSGQIGIFLFKDTKPAKAKKFGYKKKAQGFPIRKGPAAQDSEAENQPAPRRKPAADKTSSSQNSHSRNARETSAKSSVKAAAAPGGTRDQKPVRGKDFVKGNVQRVSGKSKDGSKDVNTIALTQDQLNAILKTIGQISGSENVASIEIENGDVKVNTNDKETSQDKPGDDSSKDLKPEKADKVKEKAEGSNETSPALGTENILSLLAKTRTTPSPAPTTKPPTPSKTPASIANTAVPSSSSSSPKKGSGRETAEPKEAQETGDATGGDSSKTQLRESLDEFAHLSLAERKRRKWKQELDEQVALKQQQAAQDKRNRELPMHKKGPVPSEESTQERLERRPAPSRTAKYDDVRTSIENFSPETSPHAAAPSSLGVIATQRSVPAAMRSSFLIGGQGSAGSRLNDHNAQVKKRQQQDWLQELDRQRAEARARREQDKQRQRDYDSNLNQQWAEPVEPPQTQLSARNQQPQARDDTAILRQAEPQTERQTDRRDEVEQPRSAPLPGSEVEGETNRSEGRMHIRAHNLLVDPAEMERREAQRLKHLEHMLAVKAQVEEKQRLKREADERRRMEEADEERRLAQQRTNLQHQFDVDKEKKKKKEEQEAARQRALVESMQVAYQESQQQKHMKRLDNLAKRGHDTSNLRRSWDNQPEVSPRHHHQPESQPAIKASPRVQQPVQHSPVAPIPQQVMDRVSSQALEGPVMVDAFTSPVYDQGVQTEFHFPPHEDVSLQGGQFEREPSAHIEYKPDRRPAKEETGRKEKTRRTQTDKAQERRLKTVQEDKQGARGKGTRRTQRTSRASSPGSEQEYTGRIAGRKVEKPVWGAGGKSKKLQRNSDKDLTVSKRKREERRRQRAAELLADQERNAPARLAKTKKSKSPVREAQQTQPAATANRPRAGSDLGRVSHREIHRGGQEVVEDRAMSQPWGDAKASLPDSPPLKNGDFVPFLRTDDPLMSEDSVPVTPESRQMQRHRKPVKTIVADDYERQIKEESVRIPTRIEKDPLLNPNRLKDTEQRQERILQQLSHLRQGLIMKQREMEIGLNSPVLM